LTTDDIREFCLQKTNATESFAFDSHILDFKVMDKIFRALSTARIGMLELPITLKCDPTYAIELREQKQCLRPEFHSNKRHWIALYSQTNEISPKLYLKLITHSYDMVLNNMSKKQRAQLDKSL